MEPNARELVTHGHIVRAPQRYIGEGASASALKAVNVGRMPKAHKSPGRTRFDPVILERGVTHDTEFEKWANRVWNLMGGQGTEVSLADFRKDILLDFFNEAGQKVISYRIYRSWVSEYQALPELDANGYPVTAIQFVKIENERWERDPDVVELPEPKGL